MQIIPTFFKILRKMIKTVLLAKKSDTCMQGKFLVFLCDYFQAIAVKNIFSRCYFAATSLEIIYFKL